MKVTWNWLNDYINLDGLKVDDLRDKLGSQGLEIEDIVDVSKNIENVKVGKIEKVTKHPDADKLMICEVDIGKDENIQLVSGAPNLKEKSFVPVALVGANIYGNKIKKVKLRGKESEGMICSLEELGLAEKSSGVYIFDNLEEEDIGNFVHQYLGLDDYIIDFEITSNRSDCLSVLGIAREISIATGRKFKVPENKINSNQADLDKSLKVKIMDKAKCYKYSGRIIKNISMKETPMWMRSRLEHIGIRSINIIVDITNYVMWEYGLPLHAFDKQLIEGNEIIIRRAKNKERFQTLADDKLKLNENNLVISDYQKPVALAGIIGGKNSEINNNTKNVILEAALFDPVNIRKTAKKFNLNTDSSYRFERGMDYNVVENSSNRAAFLIEKYADAKTIDPISEDKNENFDPNNIIELRWEKAEKLLGFEIDIDKVEKMFKKLNYEILKNSEERMKVKVPSYRYWDVKREEDLIEEVVRLLGYDNIPMTMPKIEIKNSSLSKKQDLKDKLYKLLMGYGVFEVYTFPFLTEDIIELLEIDKKGLYKIENPMSKELEYLTSEPIMSLLKVAETNLKRSNELVKIFEWTKFYTKKDGEERVIDFLLTGNTKKNIHGKKRDIDYFDLKAIVDEFVEEFQLKDSYKLKEVKRNLWQTGSSKVLTVNNKPYIEFGKMKKEITDNYDIKKDVWGGYFYIDNIVDFYTIGRNFKEFSSYPPVYFDLAFTVDKNVKADDMIKVIKENAGILLESIDIFDAYEGEQLPEDKKSLAFSLVFRSLKKTLKEEDVNDLIDSVIKNVKETFNAKLRE